MDEKQLLNEDVVAELLTLTCKVDANGSKRYYNKEGRLHRIHGPAARYPIGIEFWYKNGLVHREDGPAITWHDSLREYWINDVELSKNEFIRWQIKNGIKSIE